MDSAMDPIIEKGYIVRTNNLPHTELCNQQKLMQHKFQPLLKYAPQLASVQTSKSLTISKQLSRSHEMHGATK